MKFVCFGYFDEEAWAALSESEQQRFMDECFAYDDVLRKNGPIGGEAFRLSGTPGHCAFETANC